MKTCLECITKNWIQKEQRTYWKNRLLKKNNPINLARIFNQNKHINRIILMIKFCDKEKSK